MPLFNSTIQARVAQPLPTPTIQSNVWETMSAALAPSPSFVPPTSMVRQFRPHQSAAYEYARAWLDANGFAMICDDMGLGKTQVMLALANDQVERTGGYVLMIVPPVAYGDYVNDLRACFPHLHMHQIKGHAPDFATLPKADLYFCSDDTTTMRRWLTYETITKNRDGKDIKTTYANQFAEGASMLIRDEIHRDKGNMGKPSGRSKVLLALSVSMRQQRKPIVAATGTLLSNRPVEAYIPLEIIGGESLIMSVTPGVGTKSGFLYRYCRGTGTAKSAGGHGISWNGADEVELVNLHSLLRQNGYMRREKSSIKGLPHSGWNIKPIALNGVILDRYKKIEKDFLNLIMAEEGPQSMWRKAKAETITRMQAMWQEAGKAKIKVGAEYVADLIEQDKKVVVFYYHDSVGMGLIEQFKARGIKGALLNGSVTGDNRARAIEAFQNDPNVSVMVAQIKAAGMAVTLTSACEAVFIQVPWSAGDLKQAADRILRTDKISFDRALRGEAVTWHVLQACHDDGRPTFDHAMWSVLENKARVCDAVNAGKEITMPDESVTEQMLEAWYDTMSVPTP